VKQLALCLTLGAIPGFCGEGPAFLSPISLYTQFQQAPPKAMEAALHDELDSIMGPMGLHFDWRSLTASRPNNEVSVELAVINFKGRCDAAGLLPLRSHPGALGWTHVSDGNILPFSDVDCDRIRSFVQRDLLSVPSDEREETFGRAVARVLAHELYHIFANTAKHGSCGVGKAAYTVEELLAAEFVFEDRDSQALRTGKTHSALEIAGAN
jgi:hypothetical protein